MLKLLFSTICFSSMLCAQATYPNLGGCPMLPANNVWNTRVDNLRVHAMSSTWIATMGGSNSPLHPDFGSYAQNGYLLNESVSTVPPANVTVEWPFTSDPGPYPIASDTQVEDPTDPNSDHHFIIEDTDTCGLWEAFGAVYTASTNSWDIDAISYFNLYSNALKPPEWSSGNAAGTSILPGLVRYDELAAGHIDHAIIMTSSVIGNSYVWPASHTASSLSGSQYPPMGTRLRLKASIDVSGFSPTVQTILNALKTYGAILTDNGASFHISGLQDSRWNDDDLHNLTQLNGSDFEVVDESSLKVSTSSGQVPAQQVPQGWVTITNKSSGLCMQPSSTAYDAPIITAPCNGSSIQNWQFLPSAGGYNIAREFIASTGLGYLIWNQASDQPMVVPNGSTQEGIQYSQSSFVSDGAQWVWRVGTKQSYLYFRNYSNEMVAEVSGTPAVIQYQVGAVFPDNQLWSVAPSNQ